MKKVVVVTEYDTEICRKNIVNIQVVIPLVVRQVGGGQSGWERLSHQQQGESLGEEFTSIDISSCY